VSVIARLASYLRQHHLALLALFIALGGTAYAATLPRNSVGPRQLKKNAVTSKKIKRNAVTTSKIKNGQVTPSDVRDDSLTGLEIVETSLGRVPTAASATNAETAQSALTAQSAQTAGTASDAATVGGRQIAPLRFTGVAGTSSTVIAEVGPVKVSAECTSGLDVIVTATVSKSGKLRWGHTSITAGSNGAINLAAGASWPITAAGSDEVTVGFVFTAGGEIVSGQYFAADQVSAPGDPTGCLVAGTATG
jgi:hypothetical protein